MDADRITSGGIGALLGALGGYLVARWRGRRDRRDLALLRKLSRSNSQQQTDGMGERLKGLRKEKTP